MRQSKPSIISRGIKFCPKTGRPVKALQKWIIPVFSILALIWVLIRVIPKPQRAAYPCMKVAIPFASTFILYIAGLLTSIVVFKKALRKLIELKYLLAGLLLLIGLCLSLITLILNDQDLYANDTVIYNFEDPLGPNSPIGEAKGIMPGRVVWVHNPDATNENCSPEVYGDGYFLDKNANQDLIDEYLDDVLRDMARTERKRRALIENDYLAEKSYWDSRRWEGEI